MREVKPVVLSISKTALSFIVFELSPNFCTICAETPLAKPKQEREQCLENELVPNYLRSEKLVNNIPSTTIRLHS
jgi:hypothetical protein